MKLFPTLFDEAMRVFLSPVNQIGYAFARPALSLLEFSQCVTQAVAPSARKDAKDAAKDASEGGTVSLLQLPHVDEKVALALARKGKVRGAGELASLAGAEKRAAALAAAGLSAAQVSDVESHLAFVPRAEILEGTIETDGENQIVELDVVTCTMNVKLSRGAAAVADAAEGEKTEKPARTPLVGGAVVRGKDDLPPLPFCEHCDREEGWWIAIVDHAANFILAYRKLDKKAVLAAQREPRGHVAELKFNVPSAGAYALSVMVLSDYWIGADARYAVKIKVGRRTPELLEKRAAAAAGKTKEAAGKKKQASADKNAASGGDGDVAEDAAANAAEAESSDGDSGSDSDDEGREHDPDYPSEETGTEESSDEETEEEFLKRGQRRREEQAAQLKSDAAKILAENKEGDAASPAGKSAGEVEPAASAN
jgi:translocation protein SEC63